MNYSCFVCRYCNLRTEGQVTRHKDKEGKKEFKIMNPLTNMRNITKLSERELHSNDGKTSWHDEYRDSAWIFIGGLPYDLTEGDVLSVFSQYGEIVNVNLVRDKVTGKSKGFAFICFEDQRSTTLTVDNLNGVKILGRSIRVDHVKDYKPPKDSDKLDDITRTLMSQGCAPDVALSGIYDQAPDSEEEELLPYQPQPMLQIKNEPSSARIQPKIKSEPDDSSKSSHKLNKVSKKSKKIKKKKEKKEKKSKKDKKRKKYKRRSNSTDSSSSSSSDSEDDSNSDTNDRRRRRK